MLQKVERVALDSRVELHAKHTCWAYNEEHPHISTFTYELVQGWPTAKLRELLPDRMLASHPAIYIGDALALSTSPAAASLGA